MEMEMKSVRSGIRETEDPESIQYLTHVLRRNHVDYSDSRRELFASEPDSSSIGKLNEKQKAIFQGLFQACFDFSRGVLIYDEFGNDQTSRRAWEMQHGIKHAADRYSKFGKNTMNKICMALDRFLKISEDLPNTPGMKKMRELQARMPLAEEFENYGETSSYEEKEKFVEELDGIARDFLRYFAPYEAGSLEYRQAA